MYKAKVNASHQFDISEEDAAQLDVVSTSKQTFHILQNNESIRAKVLHSDFNKKTYSIVVNRNTYDVTIQDSLDQQIASLGFQLGASKQVNDIKAPMPGLILEISISKGQDVKEGEVLLILEAMKMENVINSPRDGVIKSVNVQQGDTVDKNALLIEFE